MAVGLGIAIDNDRNLRFYKKMDAREAFEKSQSPSRDEIYQEKKPRIIKQFVSRKNLQETVFAHIKHCAEEGKKESNLATIADWCERHTRMKIATALRGAGGSGNEKQFGYSEDEKDPLTGRRNIHVYYKFSSDEMAIIQDISAKILVYAGFDVNRESGVVSWANPKEITKEQREQQEREQQQEQQQEQQEQKEQQQKMQQDMLEFSVKSWREIGENLNTAVKRLSIRQIKGLGATLILVGILCLFNNDSAIAVWGLIFACSGGFFLFNAKKK